MSLFNLFRPKAELVRDKKGNVVAISPAELDDILRTQQKVVSNVYILKNDPEFYLVTEQCMEKFLRWAKVHNIPRVGNPPIKNSKGVYIMHDCDGYRGILYGKMKEFLYPALAAGMLEGRGTMIRDGHPELHAWDWFVNEHKKLKWIEPTRKRDWIYDPDFNRPVYFVMT